MRKLATGQKREKRDIGIALADTDAFAQHRGTWAVTPCVNNDLQGSQRAIQSSGKCTPATSAVQRIMVAAPNPGSVKVEQKLATIVPA